VAWQAHRPFRSTHRKTDFLKIFFKNHFFSGIKIIVSKACSTKQAFCVYAERLQLNRQENALREDYLP
jgi:hypothetical protein